MNRVFGLIRTLVVYMFFVTLSQAADFTVKEHLGQAWSNEVVTFALSDAQFRAVDGGQGVVDENGQQISCQIITDDESGARIAFQIDLLPDSTRSFQLAGNAKKDGSDLVIEENATHVRLSNALIGISLRKKLSAGEGPIEGIRLRNGEWTGGSRFSGGASIEAYSVKVTASGPVFSEAVASTVFSDGGTWKLRVRIENAEPVVLVEETYDAPDGGLFEILLAGKGYEPDHFLYRQNNTSGWVSTDKLDNSGSFFTLEPWVYWWGSKQKGNWFALYGQEPRSDMLMVGALRPSLWKQPRWDGRAAQPPMTVQVKMKDGVPVLPFSIGGGQRIWMLSTPDKAESLSVLQGKNKKVAPLPQKYLIKHGNFPLNQVKDYVLEWKGDHENYPRLFVGKEDLPRLRKTLKVDPTEVNRWTSRQPIDKYNIEEPLKAYFSSGSKELGATIANRTEEWMQTVLYSGILRQDDRPTLNFAPHNTAVLMVPTLNLTDAALSYEDLSPERRKRLLAQIAFMGYALCNDDFWSPSRGFNANPNITTTVAAIQVAIGSLIPSHPMAKIWAQRGLGQMTYQLKVWSDEDGGWLEAPHYAMVAFSPIVGSFVMADRAGFADHLYNERIPKVAKWFAKISTPRDVRTGDFRHHPPIGNTYHGESTGMFGILAGMWKDRDPEFAANMQWMCEENGSPDMGIGWSFPTMSGYKGMLMANDVEPKRPDYGSTLFRNTGVVLRNDMGAERETYLHMIAGSNHAHYDHDSGSVIIWGKGRVFADDWGYIGRHGAKYHNMLSSGSIGNGIMQIKTFSTQPSLDYVNGRKGAWQRQIAFSKDTDPNRPNFFLIRDSQHADDKATWRMWMTTAADVEGAPEASKSITINSKGATVNGADDVDMDIFIYEADKLNLKTETATQHLTCANRNGKVGAMKMRQTALVGTLQGRGAIVSLFYPRLKTETSPEVTWFADGRIAKVVSDAGVDYLFLNPAEEIAFDGKSLHLLARVEKHGDLKFHYPIDGNHPWLVVNTGDSALQSKDVTRPPKVIELHPGDTTPATVVWRSPGNGVVRVKVQLKDGNAAGGDGIWYELRHGSKVLLEGHLPNGGEPISQVTENVRVTTGDLLRLVILPGEGNPEKNEGAAWWDSTFTEMTVTASDMSWDLGQAVLKGEIGVDPQSDPQETVWFACAGDAPEFESEAAEIPGEIYSAESDKVQFKGSVGAIQLRKDQGNLVLGDSGSVQMGRRTLKAYGAKTEKIEK